MIDLIKDFKSICTYRNFLLLQEGTGPLINYPFIFPSKNKHIVAKPGPDFYQCADKLAGPEYPEAVDFYSDFLYFRALYCQNFSLPVLFNGNILNVNMVPGSGWMDNCRPGPFRKFKCMVVGKCASNLDVAHGKIVLGNNKSQLYSHLSNIKGLSAADFYMTCSVKHTLLDPASNALKANWIHNCAPLLKIEMALVKPDFMLLLGDEAIKAVLGRDKRLHTSTGKVFEVNIPLPDGSFHTAKAITCVNPAYVLRYPEHSDRFEASLNHFSALCNDVEFLSKETNINHFAVRTSEELLKVRDEILKDTAPVVAVDLEWNGAWPGDKNSYVRTVQLSWKSGVACSIIVNQAGGGFVFDGGPDALSSILNSIFYPEDGRHIRVVGHYLTSDLPWLKSIGVDLSSLFVAPEDDPVSMYGPDYKFGFEKTKDFGGFDTLLAAHSVNETDYFNLEEQAVRYCGVPRWEGPILDWRKSHCRAKGIKDSELEGYGDCPDDVIIPYGCYDADVTRRLFDYYNGHGSVKGKLDADKYGNNCRPAFWLSSRAYPAFIEMHEKGILIDKARVLELTDSYNLLYENLMVKIRAVIHWPDYNPSSTFHNRELLFGEELSGKRDINGGFIKQRPDDAMTLSLTPYKSTGTGSKGKLWADLITKREEHMYTAAVDKETLTILAEKHPVVAMLRDIRSLHYLRTTVLRGPDFDDAGNEKTDSEGDIVYDKGILSYMNADDRVRSMFSQTKETGRASSSRPNMQNLGKTIEEKYKGIFKLHGKDLGMNYTYPLRSVISARPGTVLVEADYTGAELAIMAWQSGDKNMIDHVRRANLPEDHPDHYDIHSNVAVNTFRLNCPATKKGLKDIGKSGIRTAAKAVVFGYAYGQGADSTARKAKQEGVIISVREAQELIDGLVAMYPKLPLYFNECKSRVKHPGWMSNAFGRYRRFSPSEDRLVVAEYERQSMNFPIQSAVADAMSCALDHIYSYRSAAPVGMTYDIILQVHDAVILEVPYACVEWVVDTVLPVCMSDKVEIRSCNLDGTMRSGSNGPFHLGIATEVFTKWSIPLTQKDCKVMGIPERFAQH